MNDSVTPCNRVASTSAHLRIAVPVLRGPVQTADVRSSRVWAKARTQKLDLGESGSVSQCLNRHVWRFVGGRNEGIKRPAKVVCFELQLRVLQQQGSDGSASQTDLRVIPFQSKSIRHRGFPVARTLDMVAGDQASNAWGSCISWRVDGGGLALSQKFLHSILSCRP